METLTAVVVMGALVSLLLAKAADMRVDALDAQCRANLRQWAEAVHSYALDNDGNYAIRKQWEGVLGVSSWVSLFSDYNRYMGLGEGVRGFLRTCPSDENAMYGEVSYAINQPSVDGTLPTRERVPLHAVSEPGEFLLFVDAVWDNSDALFSLDGSAANPESGAHAVFALTQPPRDEQRHQGEMNAVFGDGHVRRIHWEPRVENDPDSMVAQWAKWTSITMEPIDD